jgi:enoyl-CoA hydratase
MLYTGRVIAAEEALAQPVTMATADIHEGIRGRREHRPPAFEGS